MRSLGEIHADIVQHKAAITALEAEKKAFQAKCPHPPEFVLEKRSSTTDEYGTIDGYIIGTRCLLCEHTTSRTEEVERSRYR